MLESKEEVGCAMTSKDGHILRTMRTENGFLCMHWTWTNESLDYRRKSLSYLHPALAQVTRFWYVVCTEWKCLACLSAFIAGCESSKSGQNCGESSAISMWQFCWIHRKAHFKPGFHENWLPLNKYLPQWRTWRRGKQEVNRIPWECPKITGYWEKSEVVYQSKASPKYKRLRAYMHHT